MSSASSAAPAVPLLSVIIPTRNRSSRLHQCVESLRGQNYPPDRREVVVVIDGENQHPFAAAEWPESQRLRVLQQPHAGCAIARNTGAAQAAGEFLIFTDDDCLFPADWLSRYSECFRRHRDCLIAGRALNGLPDNPYSQTTQDIIDYLFISFNTVQDNAILAVGNNFGVAAVSFRELGGFSPRYFRTTAEDRDFGFRWRNSGKRIVYVPGLVLWHAHPLKLVSLWRQHFGYGRGLACFTDSAVPVCNRRLVPRTPASTSHFFAGRLIFIAGSAPARLSHYFCSRKPHTSLDMCGPISPSARHCLRMPDSRKMRNGFEAADGVRSRFCT